MTQFDAIWQSRTSHTAPITDQPHLPPSDPYSAATSKQSVVYQSTGCRKYLPPSPRNLPRAAAVGAAAGAGVELVTEKKHTINNALTRAAMGAAINLLIR